MSKLLKPITNVALTAMLLLTMAAVLPSAYAATTVYIDPATSTFYSDTTSVGDTFTVRLMIDDVTNMYGFEVKILYNSDMLFGVSAVRPAGHFMEPTLDPGNFFVAKWAKTDLNATHKYWWLAYTLLAPEASKSGSGVLVQFTFQILQAPPSKGSISSVIECYETKLSDPGGTPIVHSAIDGLFEFYWAPPTTNPYLSVKPTTTTFPAGSPIVGTTNAFFDVYVWINNVDPAWWLIGAEFKLAYNDTLLDFKSITVDPWLDDFGDIYMVPPVEGTRGDGLAYVLTAVLLLPHDFPPSEWWWPISGSGALVKITFEIIYQEEFPWEAVSPLDLYDVKFSDTEADPIVSSPEQDGSVVIQGYVVGRAIDVYTQYPAPYGGQGFNNPSDTFAPQDEVILCALVTYNLDPVQNKKVDFEVKWPNGDVLLTRTAFTGIDGVACISFRIPWPDQISPEDVFGIWSAWATCDLANEVINDTITFKVNWLMEIIAIETDASFQKQKPAPLGEMWFKVTWEVRSAQPRPAVITVVVYDDLGVPIAWDYYAGTFSAEAICVPQTYDNTFVLYIPTWAYVGPARVYANIYTNFPQNGGVSYGPEMYADFSITKP